MTDLNPSAGNAPALAWEAAYNATDDKLNRLEGALVALSIVAEHHPALMTSRREDAAISELLRILDTEAAALREARSAEYRAGLAMRGSVAA